jgi:hypothetical protein
MILILVPAFLFLPCDEAQIMGINVMSSSTTDVINDCNRDCDCSSEKYQPICNQTVFHLFLHVTRVVRLRNITTTTAAASTVTLILSRVSVLVTAKTGDIGHF